MSCRLVLEDGTTFEGRSVGAAGTALGEVVFSTAMTGYQEMLTDPSYAGQLLTLTYPLIGNYGVTREDFESRKVQAAGFIIKQIADVPSNWRSQGDLRGFLQDSGTVALEGIDTRALTRHLRVRGVMMGCLTTALSRDGALARLAAAAVNWQAADLWDLHGQSDRRCGVRGGNVQAAIRAPGREPPGEGAEDRPRDDHLAEPRLCRGSCRSRKLRPGGDAR